MAGLKKIQNKWSIFQ